MVLRLVYIVETERIKLEIVESLTAIVLTVERSMMKINESVLNADLHTIQVRLSTCGVSVAWKGQ